MPTRPHPQENPDRHPVLRLYHQLLQCLEEEWQALKASREDELLTLALRKEEILRQLLDLTSLPENLPPEAEVSLLKRRVAVAQERNRRLILAALEVIQEYLGRLRPEPPGTYLPAGKVAGASGASFFRRQA
jgi:flagellar biosynthesis/type III secretory pathway chaperone